MAFDLTRALIQLPLVSVDAAFEDNIRRHVQLAHENDWTMCLEALDVHRLAPLVTYALEQKGLMEHIPATYQAKLKDAYQRTNQTNITLLLTLDAILKTLQTYGVKPVVWKGAALADSFYPDPGTRPMGDLDFAIAPSDMDAATTAFLSIGFQPQAEMQTSDAIYFQNAMGVLCDVHYRVRLFENKDEAGLTVSLAPRHMSVDALPVLEPNAMLSHLVFHMDGHFNETGPILQWIFDIAFVLRKWQDEISIERLQELMSDRQSFRLFMRIVRFLEVEFGEEMPSGLSEAAAKYPPLRLETLLKQRHLALWQLSNLRGWVKLVLCRLGLRSAEELTYPTMADLLFQSQSFVMHQRW